MDAPTRQRVADIAARTRTTLVIDETMADLWYNAPPPPPLASFNPDAAVLTIGSAGKSFWGGLRIGWIRASARTIASLIQARDSLDLGTPLLEQLACCWLLENAATLLPPRREYAQGAPGHVRNSDGGIFSPLAVFATGRWALFLGGTS
ncbi:Transcriptional regulator, GntR family domain / Aspartate aminotransferase [Klebsiella pneumoniae IS53]|nr:Transcriptional regulator, GntR family domain / Aspartate aminotransferase [Klebsiella pneumoniae IS53]